MIARNPIILTGAGVAALLARGSMAPARDAAADSLVDIEISETDVGFDDLDDPIWPVKRGIDPAADRILRDMSEYIAGVETFTFSLEVAEDVLLPHGQMIQYGGVSQVAVQRPGSLHGRFRGEERRSNVVIHDGRCTLHDLEANIYAITEVPTLLDDAIDRIIEQYGLNVPVADIVSRDPYASVIGSVEYGWPSRLTFKHRSMSWASSWYNSSKPCTLRNVSRLIKRKAPVTAGTSSGFFTLRYFSFFP